MAKRMRLPNGFGQISKVTWKRLRKPWRAMVTVGMDEDTGKYKRKTLGYYATYNDAYKALLTYHDDPTLLVDKTFLDLYDEWSKIHINKIKTFTPYKAAISHCESIYNVKLPDIRLHHLLTIYEKDLPPSTREKIRQLFVLMFDYAVKRAYVATNIARNITKDQKYVVEKPHITFDDEELSKMWRNRDLPFCDVILIGCYSGWRPRELMELETKNVNITEWTFTGGMKTAAGRGRVVPIHDMIKPIVEKWYDKNEEYLFHGYGYDHLYSHMAAICDSLHLDSRHRPHDIRKTFVTRCKKYNVDEFAIKKMVGHSTGDLTEDVYTDRDIDWLRIELNKMV